MEILIRRPKHQNIRFKESDDMEIHTRKSNILDDGDLHFTATTGQGEVYIRMSHAEFIILSHRYRQYHKMHTKTPKYRARMKRLMKKLDCKYGRLTE